MVKEDSVINMNGGYPKTYANNAMNRKLERVGKPIVRKTSSKTSTKKECPPGKILSPKGRCVKDRTKAEPSKKECPPGKVISPKGRCVKNRCSSKILMF